MRLKRIFVEIFFLTKLILYPLSCSRHRIQHSIRTQSIEVCPRVIEGTRVCYAPKIQIGMQSELASQRFHDL